MKITISGDLGAGKSTVAKKLAVTLGYTHYSMGDLQRKLAAERGLDLLEWQDIEKENPAFDKKVDDRAVRVGKEEDNFVFEAHLGFHFIPNSVKIFLKVDGDIGARRIFAQHRSWEKYNTTFEQTKAKLRERLAENKERWFRYYGVDHTDESQYDLVVDTTSLSVDEVVAKVVSFIKEQQQN